MISRDEVLNLAQLARLKLGDEEVEALQQDISNILEYVGQVSSVELPTAAEVPPVRNIMRADLPRETGDPMAGTEEALRAAFPTREGGYNVVRKIIQKDE